MLQFFLASKITKFYPRESFVGVVGLNNGTIATKLSTAVLSQKWVSISTEEGVDPVGKVSSLIMRLRPNIKKIVLELETDINSDIERLLKLVQPSTIIITNSSDESFESDVKLIHQLPKSGFLILNWDDPESKKLAKETSSTVIFFGFDPNNCHVWPSNIKIQDYQTIFELNSGVERVQVNLKLLGKHQVYPALAAAALGLSCQVSLTGIKKGLESVSSLTHHLQLHLGVNGTSVLDDSYGSTPDSLEDALNILEDLPARRRVVVLGEMRDLGSLSENMHRKVARQIYKNKIDLCFLSAGKTEYLSDELIKLGYPQERLFAHLTHSQIVSKVLNLSSAGDIVLVKGAKSLRLDEVVKRITKQKSV